MGTRPWKVVPGEYPRWVYYPRSSRPPKWVGDVEKAFDAVRPQIDTRTSPPKDSNETLALLRPELLKIGFKVESGQRRAEKLHRPVLFGEMGEWIEKYEIDAFNEAHGIVVEIEAGRGWMGNAFFRDVVRMSLMVDAKFAIIGMPVEYKYKVKGKGFVNHSYEEARDVLDAVYTSNRLRFPFEGLMLVGY